MRGVVGTALTWAVGWSAIGVALQVVRLLTSTDAIVWPDVIRKQLFPAWQYGFFYGAVLGGAFAGLVVLTARATSRLNDTSVAKVGASGAIVAGALHAWVVGGIVLDPYMLTFISLGVGFASSTLLLAQRSERLSEATLLRRMTEGTPDSRLSVTSRQPAVASLNRDPL